MNLSDKKIILQNNEIDSNIKRINNRLCIVRNNS